MVAIYQACRALLKGDCSAALAGGVNVITSPDVRIFFLKYRLLIINLLLDVHRPRP